MGYNDGFDFEDDKNSETGKALREARDAAAQRAKDLEKQLTEITDKLTERNLKDVLQAKTLNPGLARFMKADGIDGSDETKVDEWLTTNGELFGIKPNDAPAGAGEPDARQAEYTRMSNVQVNALPADKFSEAKAGIEQATSTNNNQGLINLDDVNEHLRRAAGL